MASKGQSHKKKIEKFKSAHPEGRKAYAKARRLNKKHVSVNPKNTN